MPNLTIRASDDLLAALDAEAERETGGNRAAYVRDLLESRHADDERAAALESKLDECRAHVADLETELERAKRERRQLLAQREEHADLVDVVEREQSLAEKRARASVFRRFRWWLGGMDDDE